MIEYLLSKNENLVEQDIYVLLVTFVFFVIFIGFQLREEYLIKKGEKNDII